MSDAAFSRSDVENEPPDPLRIAGRLWHVWIRPALAATVAVVLLALGIANIATRARYLHVEDGVLWGSRPEGVTAIEVAAGSPGARVGIQRGDVLLAIDGAPVETLDDALSHQRAAADGTRFSYTLLRLGSPQLLDVSLAAATPGGALYYLLASVGLFTLIVGAAVRLRRPNDPATLHFFWLSVAFFGLLTFSFNGQLDRLDWVFYWGDVAATALLPALLLHFTLKFPERPAQSHGTGVVVPLIYVPPVALIVGRSVAVWQGGDNGRLLSWSLDLLNRGEMLFMAVAILAAVAVLIRASHEITSLTGRRQLRWISWGTVLGAGPFVLAYVLPWLLGAEPPLAMQLTAIPLGLVPLTFVSAIVRYRLRDVEVIVKGALVYAAFIAGSALLYFALRRSVSVLFGMDDTHSWVVALLATLVVVLLAQPVKQAVQSGLDRLFYRDRYDYRRALVAFARDLNSDLDVTRLSQRLVSRVVDTLVVDRMVMMLRDQATGEFRTVDAYGFPPAGADLVLRDDSSFIVRLDAGHILSLDGSDPIGAARFDAEEMEYWRDQGVYYFVPCVFEDTAIALLALGREDAHEPFNSEDLALLTAVAGQVATAIQNGRLYQQLHLKASELGRMREFNENILESLDEGLVVFDVRERVMRWNRALEDFYGVPRDAAVGQHLEDIFDTPFVEAVRSALNENAHGATLFKVPLTSRDGDDESAPGQRLLINATAIPLRSQGAEGTTGTILLLENITDRARLEEQLQISEKMASIGLLAAGVAHEVNTPLTGISSYTQMLLENADPKDPKTPLLEKIERQTFRAAKIVNSLLTLSRPGGGAQTERSLVDLNVVIGDVLSLLEHQLELGKIKVRRDLFQGKAAVYATEHQLQQVFLNLILNARDAMPRGGWMSISTRQEGSHYVAEVSDTGAGIPAEHLARIFDPFFTTKPIGRGTGLGLSISYGIIHEHGGDIRCDSAVGQGTRFTVKLPAAVPLARSAAN